jgi:hypothetical protein
MKPWGLLGRFLSHQWDVGGGEDVEIFGGQYLYSFNIKNGWVFAAGPTFSYNYESEGDNKLSLPLGIDVAKTAFLGGYPWKIGLQYWYYVESADLFGPQHRPCHGKLRAPHHPSRSSVHPASIARQYRPQTS